MMVADEFYNGKPWVDLSKEEVMQGLQRCAGVDIPCIFSARYSVC